MMRTSNPVLSEKTFARERAAIHGDLMTVGGTVNKTAFLLLLVVGGAAWVWRLFFLQGPAVVAPWIIGGAVAGLVAALVTTFKREWALFGSTFYAVAEGLVLGGISAIFEVRFPGIVMPAVALTFGTLLCMLLAYRAGLVRATERFKLGVFAATGAIGLVYLAGMILGFFGIAIPFIHQSGTIGILFSLFVVGVAALNLVLDFDLIEQGAAQGAPKYMEWYGAFGLLVTLVWLYMEMLRLLSKLNERK